MPPPLQASELSSPVTQDPARVPCAARLPVPLLGYQTFDGRYLPVIRPGARAPTLVILWASWCAPCMVELREIAQSAEALRAAGLEVVALSVDALGEKPGSTAAELSALLERLAFPFAAGLATEGTVQKLQLVYERLFDLHRPFPVPVSFLIGPEGDLAFVYRGPVDLRQLTTDVATTRAGHGPRDSGVVPFAGRWLRAPGRMSPYSLAWDLFENGFAAEGVRYVDDHRRLLESHVGFPALLVMAGNARMATGEAAAALALYREALALDTQYADAQNNLAWLLATHPDSTLRDGAEAVELAEAASRAMGASNPSVWDTLSAAYAEAGEFEKAVTAAEKGLSLARHDGNSRLADAIARRLDLYRSGRPFRAE